MTEPAPPMPALGYCVGCTAEQAPAPVLFRGTGLCWQHVRTVLAKAGWWAS